jgi:hypothetical protein
MGGEAGSTVHSMSSASSADDASLTQPNLTPFVLDSHNPHKASWSLLESHEMN